MLSMAKGIELNQAFVGLGDYVLVYQIGPILTFGGGGVAAIEFLILGHFFKQVQENSFLFAAEIIENDVLPMIDTFVTQQIAMPSQYQNMLKNRRRCFLK